MNAIQRSLEATRTQGNEPRTIWLKTHSLDSAIPLRIVLSDGLILTREHRSLSSW